MDRGDINLPGASQDKNCLAMENGKKDQVVSLAEPLGQLKRLHSDHLAEKMIPQIYFM